MPTTIRSCSAAVLCLLALMLAFVLTATAQSSGSSDLVISQAYGGGGNSGATYKNDFIEIFNRGAAPVDLSTYSVQYASTTGSSWQVTKLTGTIQPGQYYLVQEAAGAGGTTALPTPDATGSIAMGANGFKAALVANQTALTGSCPLTSVVDFLGANSTGTSGCSEGTPTAALSNTTGALRKAGGCTDTNVNSADFEVLAPAPRNSATTPHPCSGGGISTNPNASGLAIPNSVDVSGTTLLTAAVAPGTNPASTGLTVAADLRAIGGSATQAFYDDGTNGDVTAGDNTFSYLASVAVGTTAGTKTISITVGDSQLRTGTAIINLTVTVPVIAYPIHEIRANSSTLMGTPVQTSGVVTGLRSNGFYLQEKDGNFDGITSTAIYVYTGSTPPAQAVIGNELDITGTVAQYPVGITPTELELSGPVVKAVLGTDTPLPTAIDIAPDGAQLQSAQFEKYAGMRVRLATPNVVGPTSSGSLYVTSTGAPRPFREPGVEAELTLPAGAGANVPRYDGNPEVLRVDMSGCSNQANLAVGDATGDLTGPLGYYYSTTYGGSYSLFTCVSGTTMNAAVPVADRSTNEFTVASFNMWNFAGSATQTAKAVLEIRDIMKMPDIIGVEEVKDAASLQKVADAINAAASGATPNYQVQMGAISGTQNVGFLYRGDRVSNPSFTVLGNADKMTDTCTSYTIWDRQPFQMDATFTTANNKPFPVTVIVNHLRSLIDVDSSESAGFCARWKRQLESESLAQILAGLQQSGKNVITVGDFNAFDFNDGYVDVLGTVTGNPAPADQVVLPTTDWVDPDLVDLVKSWPDKSIYTYVENGSAQSIDHIVVNSALLARPYRIEVAHANADFPVAFSSDATRPERVSDHDQPIAYFTLPKPEITVGTMAVDFGALLITNASTPTAITVTNSGTATLTISKVEMTGEFSSATDCSSVAPGGTCEVWVTFEPKTAGTKTGSLSITHDADGSPTTVALSGVATDFGIATATGGSLSAGAVAGDAVKYDLQIAGTTGFTGTVALTCSGAPYMGTCTVSPASVELTSDAPARIVVRVTTMRPSECPHGKGFNGCGAKPNPGKPETPEGNYTLTLTATSGNVSHATNLTLVVAGKK